MIKLLGRKNEDAWKKKQKGVWRRGARCGNGGVGEGSTNKDKKRFKIQIGLL